MSDEAKGFVLLVAIVVALFLAGTVDYPDRVAALTPATTYEQHN